MRSTWTVNIILDIFPLVCYNYRENGTLIRIWRFAVNQYGLEVFNDQTDEYIASKLVCGQSRSSIARELGLAVATVSRKVASVDFQKAFRAYQDEVNVDAVRVKARMEMLASVALDRIAEMLDPTADVDKDLQARAAFGVLDRAGHNVKNQGAVNVVVNIERDEQKVINAAYSEVKGSNGKLIAD